MLPEEKIELIAAHQESIMELLGLDLTDPSLQDTPNRVAKMLVNDLFKGLDSGNAPEVKVFPNDKQYDQMLLQKDIVVQSMCEHHFVPFFGVAHVAYIPGDFLVGLSKINRIVDYYARRPQLQERLTQQIAEHLTDVLKTDNIAVVIEAKHLCYSIRGIKDHSSKTLTSYLGGFFRNGDVRSEFYNLIGK
jgi:GTP cyclohydrolase I